MKNKLLLSIVATVIMLNGSTVFAFIEKQDEVMTGARLKSIAREVSPGEEGEGIIHENGRSFGAMVTGVNGIENIPDGASFTAHWHWKVEGDESGGGFWEVNGVIPPSASKPLTGHFSLMIDPNTAGY